MKGWIYIIKNEALPGMIKLGRSDDSPEVLVKKLDKSGAVPTLYQLPYKVFVSESYFILQNIKKALWAHKKNFGQGWFPITTEEGVDLIRNQIALYIVERIRLEIRNGHGHNDFETVMKIMDSVLFLQENNYYERNSLIEVQEIATIVADIMKHQCWMHRDQLSSCTQYFL